MKQTHKMSFKMLGFAVNFLLFSAVMNAQQIENSRNIVKASSSEISGIEKQLQAGNASQDNGNENNIQQILQYYDKRIDFTENKGQWPDHVLYKADFPLGQSVATREGMIVGAFDPVSIATIHARITEEEEDSKNGVPFKRTEGIIKGHGWMMDFVNCSPSMSVESKGKHSDVTNYLLGNDASKYAFGVKNYQEVWYNNVYRNVDVRYYPSAQGTLEYDIICKAGFDSKTITLKLDGIDQMSIDKNGHLILKTSVGDMDFPAPVAYQIIRGRQELVQAKYKLTGKNELKFELGSYVVSQPLIIDPIALRWATWITNNSTDVNHGHCIWVDPATDAIYTAGKIGGTGLIITTGAFQSSYVGTPPGTDMYFGKYTEPDTIGGSGTRIWQTYYGAGDDNPYAMQQGPDGNLYVVGYTGSKSFPLGGGTAFTSEGASINDLSQISGSNYKVVVLKFDTAGTSFKASVIGGNGNDQPYDLRFVKGGNIVVCGLTTSTNLSTLFPGTGASNTNNGGNDALAFEINSNLNTISWMKNYGGSGNDQANIMLVDTVSGDIFVAGQTMSSNFPTTNPRQKSLVGTQDGFIQKLNSTGATTWSSYFNSASKDTTAILCMEFNTAENVIYFGGITSGLYSSSSSTTTSISSSGVYQSKYGGGAHDFFVVSMDTNQTFNMSTYLGGNADEINMMGLNVDLNNDVYIFGYSNSTNFPVTSDALQSLLNLTGSASSNHDKTFTKLSTVLDTLMYSTYYGGSNDDYDPVGERGIKFSNCRIYTIVTSESNNIPLTQGALTSTRLSGSSVYEPGLVVWANPPDLLGNTITGNQSVCKGGTPTGFTGSAPAYSLPNISRNSVITAYPVNYGSAASYQWQSSTDSINWTNVAGGTTQNLAGSLIGAIYQKTYFRRIIAGDACVLAGASDQTVTVTTLLVPGTVTNAACFGVKDGSITVNPFNGTSPYTYSWTGGATTQTLSNALAGTYTVVVTDNAGCKDTVAFTITQPATAVSAIKSSVAATCSNTNGSASVTASGGTSPYTYLWSSGQITSSISGEPAGTYTITVTDANKCTLSLADTIASVNTANASAGASEVITCVTGPQIQLSGSSTTSGATFSWVASNGGNIVSGANTATPMVNAAGVYTLTVTHPSDGCTATSVTSVTLNNTPPAISITPEGPLTFCQGGSVILAGNGGVSYKWSSGATTSSITVTSQGTYSVTGTDSKSCTATSTGTTVTVNSNPVITISAGGPVTFCQGGSVTLNGNGGVSYIWSTGASSSSITVSTAGTYSVTGINANGCSAAGSAGTTITINPNPQVSISPLSLCEGADGQLCASSNESSLTYLWNSGITSQCYNIGVPGTYSVTVTDVNGCKGSSSEVVNSYSTADLTVAKSGPTTFCQGGSVTLTASGANSYVWNTGSTSVALTATSSGLYTVTGSNAAGCQISVLTNVIVNSSPVVTITPAGSTTFCEGGFVELYAEGAGIYEWSTNKNGLQIEVNTSGTYSVIGTNASGCTATASMVVTVNPLPTVTLSSFSPVCLSAGEFDLNEGNPVGGIYSGDGVSAGAFDPVAAGGVGEYPITYSYTDRNGCSNSATSPMTVVDIPGAPGGITGVTTAVCANTSQSYSIAGVSGASSYTWSPPAGASIAGGQGTNSVSVNFGNTFTSGTLSVMANNGCGSTSQGSVTIGSIPATPGVITGDGDPCNREYNLYWVNPVSGAASYTWSVPAASSIISGQGTDTVAVDIGNTSGYITVSVANTCGNNGTAASLAVDVSCRTMDTATATAGSTDPQMMIYPNPAHDVLYVQLPIANETNYSIKIMDITGRVVMNETKRVETGDNLIKLNLHYARGIYIVAFTSGEINKQAKITIE